MKKIRCAIYTRKSSEDGLEQEFNSLHAQREACAEYIASQKAEGWVLLPTQYDDGGISGGTLERPAIQQLLPEKSQAPHLRGEEKRKAAARDHPASRRYRNRHVKQRGGRGSGLCRRSPHL